MGEYRYVAVNANGQEVRGRLQGESPAGVAARLRALDLYPVEIVAGRSGAERGRVLWNRRRWSGSTLALLTMQLANLSSAGVSLDRSLEIALQQAQAKELRAVLEDLLVGVRSGSTLSEAMSRHPSLFPDLYVHMVRAGEVSGHLDEVLGYLARHLESEERRRAQIRGALIYPIFLLLLAVGAVAFVVAFVVPRISLIFVELDQALPLPTRLLIAMSEWLGRYGWLVALLLAGLGAAAGLVARQDRVRSRLHDWAVRLPVWGPLATKVTVSHWARTLATLLAGGVPLLDALEVAAQGVGNRAVRRAVLTARERVREGELLAESLGRTGYFPSLSTSMIAVGEETGHLEPMLVKVAEIYEFESDAAIKRLLSLLEPIILVTMGGVIGLIVLSVLLPLTSINAAM